MVNTLGNRRGRSVLDLSLGAFFACREEQQDVIGWKGGRRCISLRRITDAKVVEGALLPLGIALKAENKLV